MRQKAYADKKRREHQFQVGEQVLLAVRQQQLPPGISSKLPVKYSGPFLIDDISAAVGKNAFKLDLPATVNIHPVFHVSQNRLGLISRRHENQQKVWKYKYTI